MIFVFFYDRKDNKYIWINTCSELNVLKNFKFEKNGKNFYFLGSRVMSAHLYLQLIFYINNRNWEGVTVLDSHLTLFDLVEILIVYFFLEPTVEPSTAEPHQQSSGMIKI